MPDGNPAQLSRELRRLGYLEGRVHRFLGRDRRTRSSVRVAWRTAGLLTIPLAFLLFGFHATADPLLLADPGRAAATIGVLLGGVLGAGFGLTLLLDLLARRGLRSRSRELLAWAAATVVMAHVGASWWHLRVTLADGEARRNGDCLVAALCLVGFVALARLFLLSESAASGQSPRRRRYLGWSVFGLMVTVVAVRWALPHESESPPPEFTARGTGIGVTWVILDGLSPDLLERARRNGWLPRLEKRIGRAIQTPMIIAENPWTPAELWTTVSTGAPTARHGVHPFARTRVDWSSRQAPGRWLLSVMLPFRVPLETTPLSADDRRAPTVGEIVARKEYRVVSVNGWCTGPAQETKSAWVVSDRALRSALVDAAVEVRSSEIVPSRARPVVAPVFDALRSVPPADRRPRADALALTITERLANAIAEDRGRAPDLVQVTLSGTDLMRLGRERPERVEQHLRSLDSVLDTFLKRTAAGRAVVICGARAGDDKTPAGWVLLEGECFRPAVGSTIAPMEVAPLVLHLLGFPEPQDQPARVPMRFLRSEFLEKNPIRTVPSYGQRDPGAPSRGWSDERRHLETLRTLGYLGGGGSR